MKGLWYPTRKGRSTEKPECPSAPNSCSPQPPAPCSPSRQPHSWAFLDPPAQLWFSDPSPTSPPCSPHFKSFHVSCSNSSCVSSTYTGQRFPVSLVTPGVQSQWKIEVCKVTSVCHILADGIIHCRGQILHESLDCPTAIPWDNPGQVPASSGRWKSSHSSQMKWFLWLPTSPTENTGQKRWLAFQLIEPKAISNKSIRTSN